MRYICKKDIYEYDLSKKKTDVIVRLFKGKPEERIFKKGKVYEIMDPGLNDEYIALIGEDGEIYELAPQRFKSFFEHELLVNI
jgi:reverse gyrase